MAVQRHQCVTILNSVCRLWCRALHRFDVVGGTGTITRSNNQYSCVRSGLDVSAGSWRCLWSSRRRIWLWPFGPSFRSPLAPCLPIPVSRPSPLQLTAPPPSAACWERRRRRWRKSAQWRWQLYSSLFWTIFLHSGAPLQAVWEVNESYCLTCVDRKSQQRIKLQWQPQGWQRERITANQTGSECPTWQWAPLWWRCLSPW